MTTGDEVLDGVVIGTVFMVLVFVVMILFGDSGVFKPKNEKPEPTIVSEVNKIGTVGDIYSRGYKGSRMYFTVKAEDGSNFEITDAGEHLEIDGTVRVKYTEQTLSDGKVVVKNLRVVGE